MGKNISLDGVEISLLKAIGFGAGDIVGSDLRELVSNLDIREILETIDGLISVGYVSCDKNALRNKEDFDSAKFHINSGYARDLKAALDPNEKAEPKSRRMRRE